MDTSAAAKALGRSGGLARARRLSPAERARIASLGGLARAQSRQAARRILDNLRYAVAMEVLRAPSPVVESLKRFDGPLPDVRRDDV